MDFFRSRPIFLEGRRNETFVRIVLCANSDRGRLTLRSQFPRLDRILTAEYNEETIQGYWGTDVNVKPRLETVEGTEFLIKVELVPKKSGELLDPQSLWFKLVLEPEVKLSKVPEGN